MARSIYQKFKDVDLSDSENRKHIYESIPEGEYMNKYEKYVNDYRRAYPNDESYVPMYEYDQFKQVYASNIIGKLEGSVPKKSRIINHLIEEQRYQYDERSYIGTARLFRQSYIVNSIDKQKLEKRRVSTDRLIEESGHTYNYWSKKLKLRHPEKITPYKLKKIREQIFIDIANKEYKEYNRSREGGEISASNLKTQKTKLTPDEEKVLSIEYKRLRQNGMSSYAARKYISNVYFDSRI